MEQKEFYQLLGQITFSYSKIEFLLSEIAVDIGIVNNTSDFYALQGYINKIQRLKSRLTKIDFDMQLQEELINWLTEIEVLGKKRNKLIHSIILRNENNFKIFYYKKENNNVIREIINYSLFDLTALNENFIKAYNDGFKIWEYLDDANNAKKESAK